MNDGPGAARGLSERLNAPISTDELERRRRAAREDFACHPAYVVAGFFAWICDNWLVGPNGSGERLHAFPQEIVALG